MEPHAITETDGEALNMNRLTALAALTALVAASAPASASATSYMLFVSGVCNTKVPVNCLS